MMNPPSWAWPIYALTCLTISLAAGVGSQAALMVPGGSLNEVPNKVGVTLYVMSRCPDARQCEAVFEDVLSTSGMYDKVDLQMSYIARLNDSAPLGISSKHGDLEVLGDAHQLCLYKHLPFPTFYATLACMNFDSFPGDIGTLDLVKKCVETVKVDWWESGVGKCIEGKKRKDKYKEGKILAKEGRKLLIKNVKGTIEKNVTRSCTIEIASTLVPSGTRTCVVDDKVWRGCDDGHTVADFVRVIDEEYKNLQKEDSSFT